MATERTFEVSNTSRTFGSTEYYTSINIYNAGAAAITVTNIYGEVYTIVVGASYTRGNGRNQETAITINATGSLAYCSYTE